MKMLTRSAVVLAVASLLGPLAIFVAPAPVWAGGQFLHWDDEGSTHAVFGPGQAVTISLGAVDYVPDCGDDGLGDTFYPASDIYVVRAGTVHDGQALVDISGVPNTVIGSGLGGAILDETIAYTAPLGDAFPARYSVVFDECQDGTYDGPDALFDNAFLVTSQVTVPPLPSSFVFNIKVDAAFASLRWAAAKEAYDWLFKLSDSVAGDRTNLADKVNETYATVFSKLFRVNDVKEGAANLILAQKLHYDGIAADPPDPNFDQLTLLSQRPVLMPVGNSVVDAGIQMANAAQNEGALAEAFLHSLERYQGAQAARDGEWALIHARAIGAEAVLILEQLQETSSAAEAMQIVLADDAHDYDLERDQWESFRSSVVADGLPDDDTRALRNAGATDAQIDEMTAAVVALDLSELTEAQVVSRLDDLRASNARLATSLEGFVADIEVHVAGLEADAYVVDDHPAADAGGPYAGTQGSPITFDGSASTSVSDVVDLAWDLDGDGQFDDGTGAAPGYSFGEPSDRLVGLRVTNSLGLQDVAYARVSISGANAIPAITGATPDDPSVTVTVGNAQAFDVAAIDPDSDDVSVNWYWNGLHIASGSRFDYPAVAGDLGVNALEAVVTDHSAFEASVLHAWLVVVMAPDGDGDGWNANVDCDDADATVNPAAVEVRLNGKDDDCDADSHDVPRDNDGDTYDELVDCNDGDAAINPGMVEVRLNGKDDDCDPLTLDWDADGDGYDFIYGDCNDDDAAINPGMPEIQLNGKDDDCDSSTPDVPPPATRSLLIPWTDSGYRYKVVGYGADAGFEALDYDDGSFATGAGAFGDLITGSCFLGSADTVSSHWPIASDLLVRKHFEFPGGPSGIRIEVAIDNGAQIFLNGSDISGGMIWTEGCAYRGKLVFNVPASQLAVGDNVLAVRAQDRGGASYFDMTVFVDVDADLPPDILVNSLRDAPDLAPNRLCDTGQLTASGEYECTLRAAIQEINGQSEPGTIAFDIPGAGPHTIVAGSSYPDLTTPMTIDATTQSGASCPDDKRIELTSGSPGGLRAFHAVSPGPVIIRGFSITKFGTAIEISGPATVECNYIGLKPDGTTAAGNATGIMINGWSSGVVGGNEPEDRNVISGNSGQGVWLREGYGTVAGNYIGTDATGMLARPNGTGIDLFDGGVTIGGSTATPGHAPGNVIAGNTGNGVSIGRAGGTVQGNLIGLAADGASALGNGGSGVFIFFGGTGTVGGTAAGQANVIARNGGAGIETTSCCFAGATNSSFLGNSIHDNGGRGISLGANSNDPGDGDVGSNNRQNFPVLTAVEPVGGAWQVTGNLDSLPDSSFRLEFFANAVCDGSGAGEGHVVVGHADVHTNAAGDATFIVDLAQQPGSEIITSTATDAAGNTSQFSTCRALAGPLVVNSTGGAPDAGLNQRCDTGNVTPLGEAECTLRAAIQEANFNPDRTTIAFDIPGAGPHAIVVGSNLPDLTTPMTIDATTQPGGSCLDDKRIELTSGSPGGLRAFHAAGSGPTVIRGFSITRFATGIQVSGPATVECNYIGLKPDGTTVAGNNTGIFIGGWQSGLIGGSDPEDRNVISGNSQGVWLREGYGTIQGNYIGTDATGLLARPNNTGIELFDGGVTVGGSTATPGLAPGNVIAGNTGNGVSIGRAGGTLQGNLIGVGADGTTPLGNAAGVFIFFGGTGSVGGTSPDQANVIAYNNGAGIETTSCCFAGAINSSFLGNSIHDNAGRGISLAANANDPGDGDVGSNNRQNFPVLASAVSDAGSLHITGSLNSAANASFRVEFFASDSCDGSGAGEGDRFLGAATTVTVGNDGLIDAAFAASVGSGDVITATATDSGGNTSQFSACVAVTSPPADTDPPDTVIDTRPANPSGLTTGAFTYHATETGSTFECQLDAAAWAPCPAGGTSYTGLTEGGHTFAVRATDPAGNTDASPATAGWTVQVAQATVFGRSQGYWGNSNGHVVLDRNRNGILDVPISIGSGLRLVQVTTISMSDKILSNSSCSGVVVCTGKAPGGLTKGLSSNSLENLMGQTLALAYNIQLVPDYTGQSITAMGCVGFLPPASSGLPIGPTSTVNAVLLTANGLIGGSTQIGATTKAQVGPMNTLLKCLNREN